MLTGPSMIGAAAAGSGNWFPADPAMEWLAWDLCYPLTCLSASLGFR